MSKYPNLKNAPITEALLDIQAELPPEIGLGALSQFQDSIRDEYPVKEERSLYQVEVITDSNRGRQLRQIEEMQGYLFRSPEQQTSKVVQARLNGFTFSKLKPYENWAMFQSEAQELWKNYAAYAHPIRVRRLGLRFINRIELPLPFDDFRKFLLTGPEIAEGIARGTSEFLVRLVIPYSELEANAIVTLATIAGEATMSSLPLLFDIDASVNKDYDPESNAIWSTFDSLRIIKNEIFFNSLTKDAEELFQ